MAIDIVRQRYTRLFEVRLLHHYWLDDGRIVFDALPDESVKTRRLLTYEVRRFLSVEPSTGTAAAIRGLRGVFRMTGLGFLVAVPDDTRVPLDATWDFFVIVTAADYSSYTALTLRAQPITDVTDPADADVIHRYKGNVPVLSNLTGASQGTGSGKRLFLSRPYVDDAAAGDAVEALVTSGSNLHQLTGDPPRAPVHDLGASSGHPVYVHQGDVPAIVPPAGTSGAPAGGLELAPDTPRAVAAALRLVPRRTGDDAFSFVNGDGTPRTPTRTFEVHFRNRWTTWRYRNKGDGSVRSTETDPLPLTHFGKVGANQKASPALVAVERDATVPRRVTRLVSEIYV